MAKLPAESLVVLRLAAFMAATPMPMKMFVDSAKEVRLCTELFGAGSEASPNDELFIRQALTSLKRYSMAQFDGRMAQFHGLVQTVERVNLTGREFSDWWRRATAVFIAHFLEHVADESSSGGQTTGSGQRGHRCVRFTSNWKTRTPKPSIWRRSSGRILRSLGNSDNQSIPPRMGHPQISLGQRPRKGSPQSPQAPTGRNKWTMTDERQN